MFDTVTFCIKIHDDSAWDPSKWDNGAKRYAGEVAKIRRLRSGSFDPTLKPVRVWHEVRRGFLCVEASLPRLVNGHNIVEMEESDVGIAIARLDALLAWAFVDHSLLDRLPSVRTWSVRRTDVLFNFRSRRYGFRAVREALVNLQPTGRMKAHRIERETVYFRGAGRSYRKRIEIAIYDKRAEVLAHDPAHHLLAEGIMRIEVRLFSQDSIRKAFGKDRPPRFSEIATVPACRRVVLDALARLHVRPGLESILIGFDSLAKRVGPRAARRLWPYAQRRASSPAREVGADLGLSPATRRRYDRELRQAGLYPAAVAVSGILEELAEALRSGAMAAAEVPPRTNRLPRASIA